jgi:hypothetical protein
MFQDKFILLQQEGFLIRTLIAQGLTALRSANLNEKGQYYAAFFGLSIGLERLLKVIIILDYMARHELGPPTKGTLRKCGGKSGHDLLSLLETARAINSNSSPHPLATIQPRSLEYEIVEHLNNFGESCGRYANLDALESGSVQSDPLSQWSAIIAKILERDVSSSQKKAAYRRAASLAPGFARFTTVVAHDLDKKQLPLQEWLETPQMLELAASHAVVHIFRILCPLKNLLLEVNGQAQAEEHRLNPHHYAVPFMSDFLRFVHDDERMIRRKKKWP